MRRSLLQMDEDDEAMAPAPAPMRRSLLQMDEEMIDDADAPAPAPM